MSVILAGAGSPPNADSLFHIWAASAGSITSSGTLTVENSSWCDVVLLSPTANGGAYGAGNPTDGWAYHQLAMRGSTASPGACWMFKIAGTERLIYSAGTFALQESTTISSTGTLTITAPTIGTSLTLPGGLISYGANDSGGAGYRLVRVPNT